jgi:cytochrome o ubiquinol oxidase subunit III
MSATDTVAHGHAREVDPYLLGRGGGHGGGHAVTTGRGAGGPASKTVIVAYGFWLFLLSDIVLFSCLFAAHAVLQTAIGDGPAGHELFKPTNIAIETACLLLSSFTCGMSAVACGVRSQVWTQLSLLVTCSAWRFWCWRRTTLPNWYNRALARSAAPSCRRSSP